MSKLEVALLIEQALAHTLKIQRDLLDHKEVKKILPVIQQLNAFAFELANWRSGKFYLKDISERFVKKAAVIENKANLLSQELWTNMPVTLVGICEEIHSVTRNGIEDKTFTKNLKDHYNNLRLALLEQVAGARMLENNSDLGEEVERILLQYLSRNVSPNVKILRGGHIYDIDDNRSCQVDLIATPADALGYCPANTVDGKYNVMIDQVIAAISVKSTLSPSRLEECWQELQKIPIYRRKDEYYPSLKNHAWPLCFIVAAYTESLEKLEEKWNELRQLDNVHIPQMILVLDSGYLIGLDASWPYGSRDVDKSARRIEGLAAGLGLGWLKAGMVGRNAILKNGNPRWIGDLTLQLRKNEATRSVPATWDSRYDAWHMFMPRIGGCVAWGRFGLSVHNELKLSSVRVNDVELVDTTCRRESRSFASISEFESRWFRNRVSRKSGKYVAFEEWLDPRVKKLARKRIVVFDCESGVEQNVEPFINLTSMTDFQNLELIDERPSESQGK